MIKGENIKLILIDDTNIDKMVSLENNLLDRGKYFRNELYSPISMKKILNKEGFWEQHFGKMLIVNYDEEIIGSVVFYKNIMEFDGYDLGCQVYNSQNMNKGYATEAINLFSEYIFNLKPINRLQACILNENNASKKVFEKCGYIHEGTLRKAYFCNGKFKNIEIYSKLRNE